MSPDSNFAFLPPGRYAKMRTVWFLPAVATMLAWLRRAGFSDVACVDTNRTSLQEQRSTAWMTFESLESFLDPEDISKTAEGHPAPQRAVFVARKP